MKQNNDKTKLNYWMQTTGKIFKDFKPFVLDYSIPDQRRIFVDNGSDVLLVAHADTVVKPRIDRIKDNVLYGAGFDDRVGCWTAYMLSLELNCDLLITDLEEACKSTAKFHDCKNYNWIVEFDRMSDDVVTYDLDNDDFLKDLEEFWDVGFGSYSDISSLKTESCCFNLGIGYENAHSKNSSIDLTILSKQIELFKEFYKLHAGTKFIIDRTYRSEDGYDLRWDYGCEICGSNMAEYCFNSLLCQECFDVVLESFKENHGTGIKH